jgi:hypothetical protein
MSSKRREYHVDRRSKKAALFFVACDANPDTRVFVGGGWSRPFYVFENAVTWLTGNELEVLLRWKGVPVSKMGNVANRRVLYQQFTYGGEEEEDDASIPAPWTDADEAGLVALRNAPIEMADTSYGRFLATQKRDTERAYQHMDAEEREAFLRKLTEIDADDAEDGQFPPSNPTPV